MTEKHWQERTYWNNINNKNQNPIIQNTFDEKKAKAPNKHYKELYAECLKGSLDIKLWQISDDLSIDDMGLLACKDVGCELNYCQTSMIDPYEQPFKDCTSQFNALNRCIQYEIDKYNSIKEPLDVRDYLKNTLEEKKKLKYKHLFINPLDKLTKQEVVNNEELLNKIHLIDVNNIK